MLCANCGNLVAKSARNGRQFGRRWFTGGNRLEELLCARCGAVIQPVDSVDWTLTRLSRLSRFGLGADDRPLLVRRVLATGTE